MRVKWYGKEVEKKLENRLTKNLARVGAYLEGDIKKAFGRIPEIPKVRTGRLRGSIRNRPSGKLKHRVETNIPYAYYLEFGFTKGGKKYFYPFMRPALDRNRKEIIKLLGAKM